MKGNCKEIKFSSKKVLRVSVAATPYHLLIVKTQENSYRKDYAPLINVTSRTKIKYGARGVMVIVAGIGHGDTSSNPGLIAFHIALIPLGKV